MPKNKVFELKSGAVYSGVLDPAEKKPGIYIGGPFYDGHAQIQLSWDDAMDLAKWLYRLRREWKPQTRKHKKD